MKARYLLLHCMTTAITHAIWTALNLSLISGLFENWFFWSAQRCKICMVLGCRLSLISSTVWLICMTRDSIRGLGGGWVINISVQAWFLPYSSACSYIGSLATVELIKLKSIGFMHKFSQILTDDNVSSCIVNNTTSTPNKASLPVHRNARWGILTISQTLWAMTLQHKDFNILMVVSRTLI